MSPEAYALLERARKEVKAMLQDRLGMGRMGWWLLNPNEKNNYAVCWAAGYWTGRQESLRDGAKAAESIQSVGAPHGTVPVGEKPTPPQFSREDSNG